MLNEILKKLNTAKSNADLFEVVKMINHYEKSTDNQDSVKALRRKLAYQSRKMVNASPLSPRIIS